MRALNEIRTFFGVIADRIAAMRRGSRFTCGDCERNARCGLPPDGNCIAKAAQLDRDGDYREKASAGFHRAVWPS